jgi:biotin transport system substrate-specific component
MFGPTGGYIWAYVAAVFLMSWFKGKEYNFRRYSLAAVAIGIPVIYLGGVLQLKGITGMPWEAGRHERRRPLHPLGHRQEPLRCRSGTALIGHK